MAASAEVGSTTGVAATATVVVRVEEGEDGEESVMEKMKVEEEQKKKDEECVFIL